MAASIDGHGPVPLNRSSRDWCCGWRCGFGDGEWHRVVGARPDRDESDSGPRVYAAAADSPDRPRLDADGAGEAEGNRGDLRSLRGHARSVDRKEVHDTRPDEGPRYWKPELL